MKRIIGNDMARLISKTDRSPNPEGCWYFTGARSGNGYGNIWFKGKYVPAHRLSFQMFGGPTPEGMHVDHLCHTRENCSGGSTCRHRACVRPSHLGLTTHRENNLRGHGVCSVNIEKTHCPKGHELSGDNVYVRPDLKPGNVARECLVCRRNISREYQRRKRAAK